MDRFAHDDRTTPIYTLMIWAACGTKSRYRILAQKGTSTTYGHNHLTSLKAIEPHPLQKSTCPPRGSREGSTNPPPPQKKAKEGTDFQPRNA
jgi:hypothetical protein